MDGKKVKVFLNLCVCDNEEDADLKIRVENARQEFLRCLPSIINLTLVTESVEEIVQRCIQLYSCLSQKLVAQRKYKDGANCLAIEFEATLQICSVTLTLMDYNVSPRASLTLLIKHFKGSALDCLKFLKKLSINATFKILSEYSQIIITSIMQMVIWNTDSSIWSKIDECKTFLPSFKDLKNAMEELSQQNIMKKFKNNSKKCEISESELKKDLDIKSSSVSDTKHIQESKPKKWKPILMAAFLETYNYAYVLLKDLCDMLCITDFLQDMWNTFNHAFTNHCYEILYGRKLDQLLLCIIYAVCKALPTVQPLEFKIIFQCYKMLPNSDPDIHRSVSLTPSPVGKFSTSKFVDVSPSQSTEQVNKTTSKDVKGDLVTFYNKVFLPKMKTYFKEYIKQKKEASGGTKIAKGFPFPNNLDSPVRVSNNLYISPLRGGLPSPPRCIEYKFSSSPGSQLQYINEMVRNSPVSKRTATGDLSNSYNTKCAKRISFQLDNSTSSNSRTILPR